jgi:RNA polymerase sigma-70 factor (ECF subfamily)
VSLGGVLSMLVNFELIDRAQGGDKAAFTEIVLAYRRRVLATITKLIPRREDVEDVGQEVFVRLWFSLSHLRDPEAFELWLYRLSVNISRDYLRKRRHRYESRLADLSEECIRIAETGASRELARNAQQATNLRETVLALLAAVSVEDRALLVLRDIEGLSVSDLERIYHVSGNALKVRIFRAGSA